MLAKKLTWISNRNCNDTFIRRTAYDIKILIDIAWCHVKSEDNPTNIVSRGIYAPNQKIAQFGGMGQNCF